MAVASAAGLGCIFAVAIGGFVILPNPTIVDPSGSSEWKIRPSSADHLRCVGLSGGASGTRPEGSKREAVFAVARCGAERVEMLSKELR
jgi:hypothetical protein